MKKNLTILSLTILLSLPVTAIRAQSITYDQYWLCRAIVATKCRWSWEDEAAFCQQQAYLRLPEKRGVVKMENLTLMRKDMEANISTQIGCAQ